MKKLFFFSFSAALVAALFFTSCQKEEVIKEVVPEAPFTIDESKYYTPDLSDFEVNQSSRAYWTTIPAGSTDMIQQAVDDAEAGGIIYLKAGTHRQTDRLVINKRVNIIGEDGAVLMVQSVDITATLNPAIYVYNAPGTVIQNVAIAPLADGAVTAVLFEQSPQSAVLSCSISDFGIGVWVEQSDRMAIIKNEFFRHSSWGVMVSNGESSYLADNLFRECTTGIWACDRYGTSERNHFDQNLNEGLFLCKFPTVFGQTIPSSPDSIGAEFTCTAWKIRNNKFTNNQRQGINIRDAANFNLVESNNEFSGNGNYDILIPPDRFILGGTFFVPKAVNNLIYASPNVLIKDCGENNTIIGGDLVDTSVDPC